MLFHTSILHSFKITRSSSKTLFLSVFKFVRKFAIFHISVIHMLLMSALCVQICCIFTLLVFSLFSLYALHCTYISIIFFFKITNLFITYLHSESIIVFISILFVFFVQLLFRIICANIYFTTILCKNHLAECNAHHNIYRFLIAYLVYRFLLPISMMRMTKSTSTMDFFLLLFYCRRCGML